MSPELPVSLSDKEAWTSPSFALGPGELVPPASTENEGQSEKPDAARGSVPAGNAETERGDEEARRDNRAEDKAEEEKLRGVEVIMEEFRRFFSPSNEHVGNTSLRSYAEEQVGATDVLPLPHRDSSMLAVLILATIGLLTAVSGNNQIKVEEARLRHTSTENSWLGALSRQRLLLKGSEENLKSSPSEYVSGGEERRRLAEGGHNDDDEPLLEVAEVVAHSTTFISDGEVTFSIAGPQPLYFGIFTRIRNIDLHHLLQAAKRLLRESHEDTVLILEGLAEINPALSVNEIVSLMRITRGNPDAVAYILERLPKSPILDQREIARCVHRHMGFRRLSEEYRLSLLQLLNIRDEGYVSFLRPSFYLGDPAAVLSPARGGDGNCFYAAVSLILTGDTDFWVEIREALAYYMEQILSSYFGSGEILPTEELRQFENLERGRERRARSRGIPHRSSSVETLTRQQLVDARVYRVRSRELGTNATDVEIEFLVELLGVAICTFLPSKFNRDAGVDEFGTWQVVLPRTGPNAGLPLHEMPALYLYLRSHNDFQPVVQVTPPFRNSVVRHHLRVRASARRRRRGESVLV
ncbi:otu family cysteine protease [Cystoisospora suis]|uniref:Otu family cysteine protease n=1 Tax=Cystoisospora suis TaxID=483139 RepID=A0A2C6K3D5_9APIC|nr:otu family cysteine protease [Cystoisospora suis]